MTPVPLTKYQLRACMKWVPPSNTKLLPVAFTIPFLFQVVAGQQYSLEQAVSTPGGYPFLLRAVGGFVAVPGPNVRFQWPNGRYLSSTPVPLFGFFGTGKSGRLLDPAVPMQHTEVIRMDINNVNGPTQNIGIFFEGLVLIPFMEAMNGK
jgi:hypothetical protein